jgi:DNA-binding CsgD family transcriptional regulator
MERNAMIFCLKDPKDIDDVLPERDGDRRQDSPLEDSSYPEWMCLLHQAIDCLSNIPATQHSQTENEIILQSELAGFQYTLTRQRVANEKHYQLSPREQQVADLLAKGLSNKSIAEALSISPWTVSTYLKRMFAKWEVASRTALIVRLVESGQVKKISVDRWS